MLAQNGHGEGRKNTARKKVIFQNEKSTQCQMAKRGIGYTGSGAHLTRRPGQICFTGFSLSVRSELEAKARDLLRVNVKSSFTRGLHYLCTGPEAGPSKIAKAHEQGTLILSLEQFQMFCKPEKYRPKTARSQQNESLL